MIVGMDFGTTNSGMAVYDGREVNVLPLDPSNRNPAVARTALYVRNDGRIYIGRGALDHYFEQNAGRPVRLERVWVGEVEVVGGDMYFVRDVYVWVDALSPGRLFLSVKTSLSDNDYLGTVIDPYFYALEDLVGLYLYVTKIRAEQILGKELRRVVLGRPVRFTNDPKKDALAQRRLVEAAVRAGYEEIYFQYEPVAAALHYELSMDREQHVLIFDFGGGTLDLTVMRLGDPKRRAVLATGGVPIAGDVFDHKLIRAKLPQHFGEGTIYGVREKPLSMPGWIYDTFSNWQTILQLQTPENIQLLQQVARTARDPHGINSLISLVSNNYSLHMFDVIELSKRRISRRTETIIPLSGPGFDVRQSVTRTEFEAIISPEIRTIEQELDQTLLASGLRADEIDLVIRTGGSSQIPAFEQMLARKFGEDKVKASSVFSSVTSGLGITAHLIETDQIDSQVHRPGTPDFLKMGQDRPHVNPVNLDVLKKRIVLAESGQEAQTAATKLMLAAITGDGEPIVTTFDRADFEAGQPIRIEDNEKLASAQTILAANADDLLLWLTSAYRFVLMTPRQVLNIHESEATIAATHRFEPWEKITGVGTWADIKACPNLVVVTSEGFVRPFDTENMRPRIEGPTPFQLDRPLPGSPVAVLGGQKTSELLLATEAGRGGRVAVNSLSVQGSQAIARRKDDAVVQALVVNPDDFVLLITESGHARWIIVEWLPLAAGKGTANSLVARRPLRAAVIERPNQPLWAATTTHLRPFDPHQVPLEEADTKTTHKLFSLKGDERLQTVFSPIKQHRLISPTV